MSEFLAYDAREKYTDADSRLTAAVLPSKTFPKSKQSCQIALKRPFKKAKKKQKNVLVSFKKI